MQAPSQPLLPAQLFVVPPAELSHKTTIFSPSVHFSAEGISQPSLPRWEWQFTIPPSHSYVRQIQLPVAHAALNILI